MAAERRSTARRRGRDGPPGGGSASPRIARRTALVGGALALAAGAGLAKDELSRLWWRMPGVDKPRTPGAVDFVGATWVGASTANWRLADRPGDFRIDRVVIHVAEGSFRTAVKVFRDPGHRAAAHYVVGEDGRVTQMVRELDVAFHAGNRAYNERSVGIEHEGFVTDRSFPDAMYQASARLTARICVRYDIPFDRKHIIAHSEVPGADHTDPGRHWDWDRYIRLVRAAADTSGG